jgi:putative component of toxin-antitoxin plasmid stabilization module
MVGRPQASEARALILTRIDAAILGNFGDCEFIAEGVHA